MRDRVLRALRGEPTDVTPVWLMRQAGRYLPGYRALRAEHSILEIARTPALSAAATLEPLDRFDLDAGVIFADISLPLAGLGVDFQIDPGVGPVVPHPVRTDSDLEGLRRFDAGATVGFVGDAIREVLRRETVRPIIGFAGAPFTLASYLVDGRGSRDCPETRRMLYAAPDRLGRLLDLLTDVTFDYLRLQADAGAHALQLFDSWVGVLGPEEFQATVAPRLARLFARLRTLGRPTIYFSTGSSHLLERAAAVGADALGVDWRLPLDVVRARVGPRIALQGNLDPGALLGSAASVRTAVDRVLHAGRGPGGYVFNLGHGVLPATDPERVREVVDRVHGA